MKGDKFETGPKILATKEFRHCYQQKPMLKMKHETRLMKQIFQHQPQTLEKVSAILVLPINLTLQPTLIFTFSTLTNIFTYVPHTSSAFEGA